MARVKFMWLVLVLAFALIIATFVFSCNSESVFIASALLTVKRANTRTIAGVHSNLDSARAQSKEFKQ